MSKETMKKATFEDLIKLRLRKTERKNLTKDIYVTSMDAYLTFKKPDDDLVLNTMNEIKNNEDMKTTINAYSKLIYLCCEDLQDQKLHDELEIKDPFDVVHELFDLGDKLEIGEQLMDLIDLGKKAADIKN